MSINKSGRGPILSEAMERCDSVVIAHIEGLEEENVRIRANVEIYRGILQRLVNDALAQLAHAMEDK